MIQLLMFVAACLALQGLKNAFRRRWGPTVSLAPPAARVRAACGCRVADEKVVGPCAAHEALRRSIRHEER